MITDAHVRELVARALAEDAPWGDITVNATIPEDARLRAALVAREAGVFAGGALFTEAFRQANPDVTVTGLVAEGTHFAAGDQLAAVEGPARAVLTAERVALNFCQRMCGIATLTARYVAAVEGYDVRIVDTRKTTPGLRACEKHAVRAGGDTTTDSASRMP